MGHTETFSFVDPRVGEYGVAFYAATKDELRIKANLPSDFDNFVSVITAYPPRPIGRQVEDFSTNQDGEIPF